MNIEMNKAFNEYSNEQLTLAIGGEQNPHKHLAAMMSRMALHAISRSGIDRVAKINFEDLGSAMNGFVSIRNDAEQGLFTDVREDDITRINYIVDLLVEMIDEAKDLCDDLEAAIEDAGYMRRKSYLDEVEHGISALDQLRMGRDLACFGIAMRDEGCIEKACDILDFLCNSEGFKFSRAVFQCSRTLLELAESDKSKSVRDVAVRSQSAIQMIDALIESGDVCDKIGLHRLR